MARGLFLNGRNGVGGGDSEQIERLRHFIMQVLHTGETNGAMKKCNVVSYGAISGRTNKAPCFRADKMGATRALQRAVQSLVDAGELRAVPAKEAKDTFNQLGKCWLLTSNFKSRTV